MVSVLCVIAICLVAALTMGTSASLNVGVLLRTENTQVASLLADSAIQEGIARLMKTPTWGSAPTDGIAYAGPVTDSSVNLTFNPSAGVPYSVNNQTGSAGQGWVGSKLLFNRTVPSKRVHLVAVGRCRNAVRTREAIVYVPDYTVSLGSTGKVHLSNSLVGSLKSVDDLAQVDTNPELLGPGDLATNSNLADSVTLEVNSRVTGNLQSRGDVSLQTGSTVGGEVRKFYSDTELPHFDFDQYDPARTDPDDPQYGAPLAYQTLQPGLHGSQNLTGVVRCPGTVTINGDLNLDNCLLYVTNGLNVVGGIRGTGAVIVKGNTKVEGGASVTSTDNVSLLSRGDVQLLGTQANPYYFQGLVYTKGNFTANYFTVVGGFVADGTDASGNPVPGNGNVDLHGSRFFHAGMATHSDFYVPYQQTLQLASLINDPRDQAVPVNDGNKFFYGLTPVAPGLDADDPTHYDTPVKAGQYPNGEWKWWNPALLEISRSGTEFVYKLTYTKDGQRLVNGVAVPPGQPDPPPVSKAQVINLLDAVHSGIEGYHDGLDAHGDPYDPEPAQVRLTNFYDADGNVVGQGADPGFLGLNVGDPNPLVGLRKETGAYLRKAYELKLDMWAKKNLIPSSGGSQVNFSFDPNRFLKQNDKIRLSAVIEY